MRRMADSLYQDEFILVEAISLLNLYPLNNLGAVAGLLTEPRWLGQETGHSAIPQESRRYRGIT